MEKPQKVWLITGATAGLGRALAITAADAGHRVIGTSRDQHRAALLHQQSEGKIQGLVLDITQKTSVKAAVGQLVSTYGHIDVLVNNAGYGLMGATEEVSDAEASAQMETNFFGPLRLIRAVLPLMRSKRSGHVINISSRLGITASPLMGLYAASKFALEGVSEALYQELLPFNVHVTLVEPGPLRTEFFGSSIRYAESTIAAYTSHFGNGQQVSQHRHGHQSGDPVAAARAIFEIVDLPHPPLRLPLTTSVVDTFKQKAAEYEETVKTWKELANSIDRFV